MTDPIRPEKILYTDTWISAPGGNIEWGAHRWTSGPDPIRPPETDADPWAVPDVNADRGGAVAWMFVALVIAAVLALVVWHWGRA